jgi:hypothetical protein
VALVRLSLDQRPKQERNEALGLQTHSLLVCHHYQEKKVETVEEPVEELAQQ